ncbi:hypothetical protein CDL15_Pgr014616 [Punica granatum]|uniref:Endonuclease/exonuclease/phosphatase domain-containing protein n=1 Tax=Punica granatum TaxID=22663 RepID=A0A218XZD1_PUNGR|nr:hypothetical protein CDL15_Pgr014616 [Punica granatum]
MGFDVSFSFSFSFSPFQPTSPHLRRSGKPLLFLHTLGRSPSAFRCSNNELPAAGSSPALSSYASRWINPLRRRPSPEIVRHWIEADPQLASEDRFTLASYNILGDRNASKHWDLYADVPPSYMKWERRRRVICEELMGWGPDIICLQEVDRYIDLSESMQRGGYVGSYKRRTGDSVDGCAIFWRDKKLRLLEAESIEFKALGLRDNVAQLSVFEIRFLSSRAHSLAKKWGNIPILLSGDFNTTPQSAIYEFLSKSQLDILLHDRRELSGQRSCHPSQVFGQSGNSTSPFIIMDRLFNSGWSEEEVRTAGADAGVVAHPLKLNSAYSKVNGSGTTRYLNGEPLATSYHSKFFGTVDYIWYSDGLVPTRVLDTPPINILRRTGGLPCENVGSDHLALVSEFAFTDLSESWGMGTSNLVCRCEDSFPTIW